MRRGKQTMTMAKRMRHSPNLSNLDVMKKNTVMILSILHQCRRCPPSGGTQKTVVPDGMAHTTKVSIHLARPPHRLT